MRTRQTRGALAALFVLLCGGLALTPAGAVEDGLMGARIGASYREVMRKFGQPVGMLMNAGGGMMYQALPSFRGGFPLPGQGGTAVLPTWAEPVRVGFLGDQQAEWLYDMRRVRGITVGVVLSGEGADAVVTDVIISGYPEYLKKKRQFVRTELGVTFQSSFATVIEKYGFPPQIEVFTPGSAPPPGVSGGGGRAGGARGGGGVRGGGGRGGGGGMRGGGGGGGMRGGGGRGGGGGGGMRRGGGGGRGRRGGALPGSTGLAATDTVFTVELTQGMRGGGGGMRGGRGGGGGGMGGGGGGGMRGGRGGGGGRRGGGGTLPPLGAAGASSPAAAMLSRLSASAMVNNQVISFSRDSILTYRGIAFTLHDMRVIRIHVSE